MGSSLGRCSLEKLNNLSISGRLGFWGVDGVFGNWRATWIPRERG